MVPCRPSNSRGSPWRTPVRTQRSSMSCNHPPKRWRQPIKICKQPLYRDVIMGKMASQITSLTIVYWTVYSGADQRKQQSSASLDFVWGISNILLYLPGADELRTRCSGKSYLMSLYCWLLVILQVIDIRHVICFLRYLRSVIISILP